MQPTAQTVGIQLAGTEVSFETGRIARQASGAVVARAGEDTALATVVASGEPTKLDFFPLTVEYREKLAAVGAIPGAFLRREGRINDREVLTSRMIDRTVRSLFPDSYAHEVQIQVTVLSATPASDPTTLALLAACAALHLSPVPAKGPAAGVRVVRHQQRWTAFPSRRQQVEGDVDLVVSAGPDGLVMVEGGANEAPDGDVLEALRQAIEWTSRLHATFDELRAKAPVPKAPAPPARDLPALPERVLAELGTALRNPEKAERYAALAAVESGFLETLEEPGDFATALKAERHRIVRSAILDGRRLDGRKPTDVRPIWCEIGWLPRPHGSAIFTRGETQALATCTLGTDDDAQRIDGLDGQRREHFLLHYNFPPYSVGEVRPLRGPGRREIGHGALARRGLAPVLPSFDEFPYTIRIESEISESNGSSSMATVCGGTLAMMHAGVPIARPVAGIAMGLVADGERTAILSDILGDEDHLGDMDFKVVGTERGITALQLDNKIGGLSFDTLADAIGQARQGLGHILGVMAETIDAPSAELSPYSPRVTTTAIMPSSISALVGPRGVNIRGIQSETDSKVTVDDDGMVRIYAADQHSAQRAMKMVGKSAGVVRVGGYYTATVLAVKEFGLIVRINDANEGVVTRGELHDRSAQAERRDYDSGDDVVVRVTGVDDRGRLNLSIRAAFGVDEAQITF